MIDVDPHIDLTTDDLLFVVDKIGAARPVGLDEADSDPVPPPEVREWLQNATERNLRARGIVNEDGNPHPAVAEMVSTTGSPGLIVSVSAQRGRIIETSVVAAVPDLAVVHSPVAPGVHRLTPIAPVDVVDRLRQLVQLNGDAVGGTAEDELRVDLTDLDPLTAAAEESSTAAADAAREVGLPAEQAEKLASLLTARDATYLVTVMHRSPEVHMGVVSWWSAGKLGLWQVQTVDEGSGDRLVLSRVSSSALLDAVRGHLPGVLSSPD